QYHAASLCGAVLGLKKGSRLYRRLVRERRVASDAKAFTYDLSKGSDLLVCDVTGLPETSGDDLERAVAAEIDALLTTPVTEEEVARAVALIESDYVTALQSAGERADRLSMFATYFSDPGLINEQVAKYRAVTADAVNAFARERLGTDNRVSLI